MKIFSVSLTVVFILISILLAGCNTTPERTAPGKTDSVSESDSDRIQKGRYAQEKDNGPTDDIDLSHIPDAVPRREARTIAGNKNPYTILGKTYHLIKDESSYKERGYASWYGKKFNGFKTSNGEIYDMYAMTAAHKTLPIPSYVRVTNVTNGKTVVVRVNDRGPFHEGRVIDLSYAAAQRIGIHKAGTGLVDVEIALPDDQPAIPRRAETTTTVSSTETALPPNTFLQIAAFSKLESAKEYSAALSTQLIGIPVIHSETHPKEIHRVRLGPFKTTRELQNARDQLAKLKLFDVHVVYLK
jgi:rare lipoprotein A